MSLIEPLDFQYLLVNTLSGNFFVFILLAGVFIATMAARFRMPSQLFVVMVMLFSVVTAIVANWILALVIIVVALVIFALMVRFVR